METSVYITSKPVNTTYLQIVQESKYQNFSGGAIWIIKALYAVIPKINNQRRQRVSETQISVSIPPPPPKKPRSRSVIVVAAIIIIAVVWGCFLYYWVALRPRTVWLFKGAYATYEGNAVVSFVSLNVTIREEVVDFNNTHAQLLTYFRMTSSITGTLENQSTTWVDLYENEYSPEGANLTRTYEDYVYVENLGTRHCIVFEYEDSGTAMTIYVDKEIEWPVKMTFGMTGQSAFSIDLNLVDTNIPGLKK